MSPVLSEQGLVRLFVFLEIGGLKIVSMNAATLFAREQAHLSQLATRYFRISEAARILGVRPATIRRWVLEKKVAAVRTGGAGWFRLAESELKKLQGEA